MFLFRKEPSNTSKLNSQLLNAAKAGDVETVGALLTNNADVNYCNSDGDTPLHWASKNGHKDIVTLLLDNGANPDLQNNDKWAPLHLASRYGHKEIVALLLDRGANPDLQNNNNKWAPLHLAAQNGHKEIATLLLDKGANPDLQNNEGESALHWAAQKGHKEIVTLLLDRGANPDLQNKYDYTPLHQAAKNGHKEIVTLLLDKGANPDLQDNDKWAPLHWASAYGHKEIITLLLDKGANPNLQNHKGESALHRAAQNGCKEIVTLLLDKGANPDLQDMYGAPPLEWAAFKGRKEIVNLLSDKEAYSEQRLKRKKINKLWKHQPKLIYAEVKFLIEHLALWNLWSTCKDIYATDNTTVGNSQWFELPVDIRKVIIGFLAGNERTTEQLDDLYKKMVTNRVLHPKKLFVENLFTDYLKTWGQLHAEAANSFLNKGLRTVTAIDELKENTNTFYQTFNGAPQITGTMKALTTLIPHAKKETAESNNNTAKQKEQPQDKWKQQRTGYDPEGRFFRIAVKAQHKINGIKSLTLKDDKGKEFTPPTPKG